MRRLRTAGLVTALIVLIGAVGMVQLTGQPFRSLTCWWEQRDGWELEFPQQSLPENEFRNAIENQTKCVEIVATYVNTDDVPDGHMVRPIGARGWVGSGQTLDVLVEALPEQGAVQCGEPLGHAPPGAATELLSCADAIDPPG